LHVVKQDASSTLISEGWPLRRWLPLKTVFIILQFCIILLEKAFAGKTADYFR